MSNWSKLRDAYKGSTKGAIAGSLTGGALGVLPAVLGANKKNDGLTKTLTDPLSIGWGDKIFGNTGNGDIDNSSYESEQAAAIAAEQAAYDDFINGGPSKYSAGDPLAQEELSVGDPLTQSNYQVGDELEYETLDPNSVVQQGNSSFADIQTDPRLVNAQSDALRSLEERANEGLTLQDQADMARLQNDVNRRTKGRLGAIQQNMQARGIGGSGLDLVAQQQASQDATETEALASLEKAAQSQNNKRAASIDAGNMATGQRGQAFGENAAKAAAQDAISRFNVGNQVNQQRQNLDLSNQAANQNWGRGNAVSDNNIDLTNQTTQTNWGRTNSVNDQNTNTRNNTAQANWGRNNQTADNNVQAAGNFARDKLNASTDKARTGYDYSIDRENRATMQNQQNKAGVAGKFGAVLGAAGGIMGGIYGGPQGAAGGMQAGQGIGGAVGNQAYENGYRKKRYAHGGMVEGEAEVVGDNYNNDTVDAKLSPGEIVIPRSISHDPKAAKKFVEQANEQDAIQSLLKVMQHVQSKNKRG